MLAGLVLRRTVVEAAVGEPAAQGLWKNRKRSATPAFARGEVSERLWG